MDTFGDVRDNLNRIAEEEELLETIDPVNKPFLEAHLAPHKIKVYDAQHLPYTLSDEYLEKWGM